jgi:uncharacterized protein YjbJ (UPF0337 family)
VSHKIKLTWGKLSEDDIPTIAAQRDQFARLLQGRYGYEQDNAKSAVEFAQPLDIRSEALDSVTMASNTSSEIQFSAPPVTRREKDKKISRK